MSIEEKIDELITIGESINAGIMDMVDTMEKMGQMIKAWHDDDLLHHKEENSLIKQTFKERGHGA